MDSESYKVWIARKRQLGICTHCSKKAVVNKASCQNCLDRKKCRANKTYKKRIENSECVRCGQFVPSGHVRCIEHAQLYRNYTKNKKRERRSAGICWKCKSPTVCGRVLCSKCNEKANKRIRKCSRKARIKAIQIYGGKCACCGESEISFLDIDHINNDGASHRRKVGRSKIERWLKKNKYPEGFQVLCANCNASKSRRGGTCAHAIKE